MGVKSRTLRIKSIILAILILFSGSFMTSLVGASDSDGDGWDDLYENYLGTDPNNPDTDGDYIPDNEDPTPKGGLLNEDEIWEVFLVDLTSSAELVDEGSKIELTISVEELLPKGIRVPVDNETGNLKAYWGYTPTKAGLYYFVLVMGDDTLGSQTNRYEMDWLNNKGKGGYCSVAVYPHYYATVSTIYYDLLPGMTGAFSVSFYEFDPKVDLNLSLYSSSVSLSTSALTDLYVLSTGSVQLQVARYSESTSHTIKVENTTIWTHEFLKTGHYTISSYSTFLLLGTAINRVPLFQFLRKSSS